MAQFWECVFLNLKESLLSSAVMRVASAVLTFLNGVVLARVLGPEFYGQYVLIFSWISLGYFLSTAGLPVLVLREVSLNTVEGNHSLSKGVLIFSIAVFLGLLGICGLVYGLTQLVVGYEPVEGGMGWVAWAIVLLWGLSILFENATRGLGRTTIGQVAELLLRPGLGLLFLVILTLIHTVGDLTYEDAILALFAATLATAGFSGLTFWCFTRQRWSGPAQFSWLPWIHGGALNSATSILITTSFPISFLLIGHIAGAEELGIYRVAYQLSVAAGMGLLAAKAVIAPQVAKADKNGGRRATTGVYLNAIRLCMGFSIPVVLALMVFPDLIVETIFGETFLGGKQAVRILALSVLINSAFGPIDILLQVGRKDSALIVAALIRTVCFLSLVALLTPAIGITGGAIAHTLSVSLWCVILLFFHLRSTSKSVG